MQTSASPSMFRSFRAALCRAWQALAARRAQAAHQRRMAEELLGMSEREMLDLAIGRGERASWLLATPGQLEPEPRQPPRNFVQGLSAPAQGHHRLTPVAPRRKLPT